MRVSNWDFFSPEVQYKKYNKLIICSLDYIRSMGDKYIYI